MREKITNFVQNNKINFVAIAFVYSLLTALFPFATIIKIFSFSERFATAFVLLVRALFCVLPVIFFKFYFSKLCKFENKSFFLMLVLFAICVNNFPFVSLFCGDITLESNVYLWCVHIADSIITATLEEIVFRGVIFVIILDIFSDKKYKFLSAIILQAVLFSLTHFVNLFAGTDVFYVLLQICYSFLMGVVFALSFALTKSILIPIILHTIYNFGGLLLDNGLLFGSLWAQPQFIFSLIIDLILGAIVVVYFIKIRFGVTNESSCTTR